MESWEQAPEVVTNADGGHFVQATGKEQTPNIPDSAPLESQRLQAKTMDTSRASSSPRRLSPSAGFNREWYQGQSDELLQQKQRSNAHPPASNSFNARLNSYMAGQVGTRNALRDVISDSYQGLAQHLRTNADKVSNDWLSSNPSLSSRRLSSHAKSKLQRAPYRSRRASDEYEGSSIRDSVPQPRSIPQTSFPATRMRNQSMRDQHTGKAVRTVYVKKYPEMESMSQWWDGVWSRNREAISYKQPSRSELKREDHGPSTELRRRGELYRFAMGRAEDPQTVTFQDPRLTFQEFMQGATAERKVDAGDKRLRSKVGSDNSDMDKSPYLPRSSPPRHALLDYHGQRLRGEVVEELAETALEDRFRSSKDTPGGKGQGLNEAEIQSAVDNILIERQQEQEQRDAKVLLERQWKRKQERTRTQRLPPSSIPRREWDFSRTISYDDTRDETEKDLRMLSIALGGSRDHFRPMSRS